MYATHLQCTFCGTHFPLTKLGSCPRCARPGEESALHETLGVCYDITALKKDLDRDELERRPPGITNIAPPISHRVSGYHAYHAIQASGGGAIAVSDAEMLQALRDLASYEGIYCEAASASALAGIRRAIASGLLTSDEIQRQGVVGILTSSGLKNTLALSQVFSPPPQIEGTWEALQAFLA